LSSKREFLHNSSSHNLELEHDGRYFNISADQRICKLCKLTVEDEIHFLLECPKLEEARHVTAKLVERLLTSNAYLQIFLCTFLKQSCYRFLLK
jgi:hypothetical protein